MTRHDQQRRPSPKCAPRARFPWQPNEPTRSEEPIRCGPDFDLRVRLIAARRPDYGRRALFRHVREMKAQSWKIGLGD